MSYKDLEDKITQDKIAIRYNVVAEGAAMKAEDYPEVKEILPTEEPFRKIALEILYEDKINALKDVKKSLEEGYSPIELINNALMKGIDAVSTLYTKGVYFLPDLMLAGDAMMESVKECEKVLGRKSDTKGTVVCFVAEGDPHDIGKNLILMFLRAGGFEAIDLGRDVAAQCRVLDRNTEASSSPTIEEAQRFTEEARQPRMTMEDWIGQASLPAEALQGGKGMKELRLSRESRTSRINRRGSR